MQRSGLIPSEVAQDNYNSPQFVYAAVAVECNLNVLEGTVGNSSAMNCSKFLDFISNHSIRAITDNFIYHPLEFFHSVAAQALFSMYPIID